MAIHKYIAHVDLVLDINGIGKSILYNNVYRIFLLNGDDSWYLSLFCWYDHGVINTIW